MSSIRNSIQDDSEVAVRQITPSMNASRNEGEGDVSAENKTNLRSKKSLTEEKGKKDKQDLTVSSNGVFKKSSRRNMEMKRRRQLLQCSLALNLVKVGRDSGKDTVEDILNVLTDEYFDLEDFMKTVKTVEDCEKVARSVMDSNK